MTERYIFDQPGRSSSEIADQTEAMIRCAALQAAATLEAGIISGGIVAAATNNIRLPPQDIRTLVTELVNDVASFALEFEKHLRGEE